MGLNDGKKTNTDLDDEGGIVGEVGVTTVGSTVSGVDNDNDDLTNLTWLQDRNLLKSMTSATSSSSCADSRGVKSRDGGEVCSRVGLELLDDHFGDSDVSDSDDACDDTFSKDNIVHFIKEANENVYPDDVCSSPEDESSINKTDGFNLPCSVPPVPYNPKIHIHAKPPYSFSSLIFMAIESSPSKALPVKDIYAWIVEHFPYYQNSPSGWKNTVRHNLSLNKCFKKLDKGKDELVPIVGKGSLWCVDPNLRPNLLQAVRRTPAHIYPYMSTSKTNFKITPINELSSSKNRNLNDSRKILTFDQIPQIGNSPLLGKRLLIPIINRESEEADAAQSMLTLTRYNSEESRSLITDVKSDPDNKPQEYENNEDNEDDYTTNYHSPTGDHNYFSRSSESKKLNIKLLKDAQKLIHSEKTTSTRLTTTTTTTTTTTSTITTTTTSISNPKVKVISTSLTTNSSTPREQLQQKSTTESDLKEKDSIDCVKSEGNGKRKVDFNEDDDGLKGAQALLNLATRGLEVKPKDEIQQLAQLSVTTLPISLPSPVKNIIDNVINNSVDTASIGLIKKRRET